MPPRRLLLDTHTFIWFIENNIQLSVTAMDLIADSSTEVLFSIVSAWEMTIKAAQGKLHLGQPMSTLLPEQLALNRFTLLPIELGHLKILESLPFHHKDPFDRVLIAQSISESIPLVSADTAFDDYATSGLVRVW